MRGILPYRGEREEMDLRGVSDAMVEKPAISGFVPCAGASFCAAGARMSKTSFIYNNMTVFFIFVEIVC
jgi:hypothetical protein